MTRRRADVRVGISGWRYPEWRGTFYPKGLAQRHELEYASREFRTIEINGSFYSLQRPSTYTRWYDETPDDFVFAVKGSRFVTHNKKLRECQEPLARFFTSGVLALGEKLGPILWQLPPQLRFDEGRLASFFDLLPRGHLRHALEVRHDSFDDPAFFRLLRRSNIALCVADTAGRFPLFMKTTTDLVYVRLHGSTRLYASGYSRAELDRWAHHVETWRASGHDVYVYFDNDAEGHAPFDALHLVARLGRRRAA